MMNRRIGWVIAAVDVVVFLVTSLHSSDGGYFGTLLFASGIATYTFVGAVLWTRIPDNPIGPLLLVAGTLLVVTIAVGVYADVGIVQTPPWPGAAAARVVGDTSFIYPFVVALVGVPLVFPDGRLPSPRYRWVVRMLVGFMVVWTFRGLLFDAHGTARLPAVAPLEPLVAPFEGFVLVATLACFGASIFAVWSRFRQGNVVQRQQIKWLAADIALAGTVLPLALLTTEVAPNLADAFSSIAVLAMLGLPVVIGIAVLRYRLFEIDRIISRTIGWALVSLILAVLFVGVVVGLQAALAAVVQENTLAVAASTLVAAALFQPLRARVQRAVDRRFDRARYDGERLAAAFGGRLRDEVDLASLRTALAQTADDAVKPIGSSVWLRTGGGRTR